MKILIPTTAIPGHLNPMLALAKILVKHGHEVQMQTSSGLKRIVDAAGLHFTPLLPEADETIAEFLAKHPGERPTISNYFLPKLPAQLAGMKIALRDFPADAILTESMFYGTLPLLLGERKDRPAIIHAGITVLNLGSGKNLPPSAYESESPYSDSLRALLQKAFNETFAELGYGPLPCPVLESMSTLPDLYLHPGIRSFQYPGVSVDSSRVHYIGQPTLPPGQYSLPDWWKDLDKNKRLVLVTQGTVANVDMGSLIGPTLQGLSEETDLQVLATTGGRPAESIPVDLPPNALVASFLPYEQILSKIDLLITNGGYGTVNLALAQGVPIIAAGLTEDKAEVSANLEWSGAGINLRTNKPSPEAIRSAARKILDDSTYRDRAQELAREFKSHDTESELLALVEARVKSIHG